jgi:hypothetical protein
MAQRIELPKEIIDEVETALALLEAGIPLTLLLDLATPVHSADVYRTERGCTDWVHAVA